MKENEMAKFVSTFVDANGRTHTTVFTFSSYTRAVSSIRDYIDFDRHKMA